MVIPLQRGDSRAHACGDVSSLPTADVEAVGTSRRRCRQTRESDGWDRDEAGGTEVEVPSTSNPVHKADVCVCVCVCMCVCVCVRPQ